MTIVWGCTIGRMVNFKEINYPTMFRLYTLLILMVAFAACKKEEKTVIPTVPERTTSYLSRVTYFDTLYQQELPKDSVQLNSDGTIAYVGVYNEYYDLQEFIYDSKGNIIEANGDFGLHGAIKYRFEYNADGSVSKRTWVASNTIIETVAYTYDAYNRLAKEERINSWYNINTIREYIYANAGTLNPSAMKETGTNPEAVKEYLYTYDNKPNPYSTLPKMLYFMGIGEPGTNNVLSVSVRNEVNTATNVYRYNGDNLPFNSQSDKGMEYKYYYTNN